MNNELVKKIDRIKKHINDDCNTKYKFVSLLRENNIDYISNYVLGNVQFDVNVNGTLIDIDACSSNIDKYSNKNKLLIANKNNFRYIHVFEWDDINKVINLMSKNERIYARDCDIKEVSSHDAKKFIDCYHLQNYAKDIVRVGLYFNNELVSIMTFGKPRYNKNYDWELIRYCSNKNVIGGSSKLFNYFINKYDGSIISYCDLSKFNGKTYDELLFKLIRTNEPSKHWYNKTTKKHITNNLLLQKGVDYLLSKNYGKGSNNDELMVKEGFTYTYDCGQATYVYDNKHVDKIIK